jgi:hypothetical protein
VRRQIAAVEEVGVAGLSIVTYSVRDLVEMIGRISDELITQLV